jgi:hypothetical protein
LHPRGTRSSPIAEFHHPLAKLILETEILRALNRRQELSQLALLVLLEIESLTLKPHHLIEKRANLLLIGAVTRHQLRAQRLPRLPLLRHQRNSLPVEFLIRRLEPRHLVVVQLELPPDDLGTALAEATFQLRATLSCGRSPRHTPGRYLCAEWRREDRRHNKCPEQSRQKKIFH